MKRRVLPGRPLGKNPSFLFHLCSTFVLRGWCSSIPFRPSVSVELATVCLFFHLRFSNLPVKATKIFSLKVGMGKIFLDPSRGQPWQANFLVPSDVAEQLKIIIKLSSDLLFFAYCSTRTDTLVSLKVFWFSLPSQSKIIIFLVCGVFPFVRKILCTDNWKSCNR